MRNSLNQKLGQFLDLFSNGKCISFVNLVKTERSGLELDCQISGQVCFKPPESTHVDSFFLVNALVLLFLVKSIKGDKEET